MARVAHAEDGRAARFQPLPDAAQDGLVHTTIANHAALADVLAAGLELRLDQHEAPVAGPGAF